jgi:N-acetylneuraminic acid mutarotase
MNQARGGLGVVAVNDKIYAIGGFVSQTFNLHSKWVAVGNNDEFDPLTNNWTAKASMPTLRAFFAIAVCQNKIYCIGGTMDFSGFSSVNEVYDPATNSWEKKASMPTVRVGVQANVVNGKIYLTGGMDSNHVLSKVTEVYDPSNNTWSTKADIPYAAGEVSTVIDNKIYSFGTYYNYSNHDTFSVTQIYSPETDTWSQGTGPPDNNFGGKYGASGVATSTTGLFAPKRVYVYCGYSHSSPLQVYDPQNDSWALSPNPPLNPCCGVGVVDDRLYFIGGYALIYPNMWSDPVPTCYSSNMQYTPIGFGTVPPIIAVTSPTNLNFTSTEVSLNFTVNKPVTWLGYALDGEANVTFSGNLTLRKLSDGLHTVVIYANDSFGNMGASQIINFTIARENLPIVIAIAVSGTMAAIIMAGLLFHFKKRRSNISDAFNY